MSEDGCVDPLLLRLAEAEEELGYPRYKHLAVKQVGPGGRTSHGFRWPMVPGSVVRGRRQVTPGWGQDVPVSVVADRTPRGIGDVLYLARSFYSLCVTNAYPVLQPPFLLVSYTDSALRTRLSGDTVEVEWCTVEHVFETVAGLLHWAGLTGSRSVSPWLRVPDRVCLSLRPDSPSRLQASRERAALLGWGRLASTRVPDGACDVTQWVVPSTSRLWLRDRERPDLTLTVRHEDWDHGREVPGLMYYREGDDSYLTVSDAALGSLDVLGVRHVDLRQVRVSGTVHVVVPCGGDVSLYACEVGGLVVRAECPACTEGDGYDGGQRPLRAARLDLDTADDYIELGCNSDRAAVAFGDTVQEMEED